MKNKLIICEKHEKRKKKNVKCPCSDLFRKYQVITFTDQKPKPN
jgi:hypothetical protein